MDRDNQFRKRAGSGYRVFRRRRVLEAATLGFSLLLPIGVAGLALGMALRYRPLGGWIVPLLAVLGIGAGAFLALRFGLGRRLTYPQFLRYLERRLRLRENELVNADELERELDSISDPLSRGLAAGAVRQGLGEIDRVPFGELAPTRSLRRPALQAVAAVAAGVLLFLAAPDAFRSAAGRLLAPGTYDLPPAVLIQVRPGNVTIQRGESVRILARMPAGRSSARLYWRAEGGAWTFLDMLPSAPDPGDEALASSPAEGGSSFALTLSSVMEPTEYSVASGPSRSPSYTISVTEPLRAAGYRKKIEPPAYTGLAPTQELAAEGSVSAIVGSRVTLGVTTSRPDAQGRLVFADSSEVALDPLGDGVLSTTLDVRKSGEYHVELTARDLPDARWASPAFQLDAVPDRMPTLYQLAPERSVQLPPDMQVEIDADCLDDFGLTRLDLVYQRNEQSPQRVNLGRWQGERETRVVYPWDLEGIALTPGDVVRYHLELTDNDAVSGPKTTRGPQSEVRFPTVEEMYAKVEQDRGGQVADVQQMLEQQQQLQVDLEKTLQDLKQQKALRWEQQEQIKDLADRQDKVSDQLEQLASSLDQSLQQMQQAELFSPEMIQKIDEIGQLVRQIQSPQFKDYLQKLRDALDHLDRRAVEDAMENLHLSQEDLAKSLDRTLELLKKMKLEENLDQLVQSAQRLHDEQQKLNDELGPQQSQQEDPPGVQSDTEEKESPGTESSEGSKQQEENRDQTETTNTPANGQCQNPSDSQLSKEQAQALKERQEQLQKQLQELQKALADLRKQAEENWKQLKEQLDQQQGEQKLSSAQENMAQASKSMSSCNKSGGKKFGRKAEQNLAKFSSSMAQLQSSLQAQQMKDVSEKLFFLSGQLVQLSTKQELLLDDAPSRPTRDLASDQSRVTTAARGTLDSLYALGKQTQFLSPQLVRVMGEAVRNLEGSTHSFEDGNRQGAMAQGRNSTVALDKTVIELLNANQQMCNSGSCSNPGKANPMSRLRGLSAQQQQLNAETESMLSGRSGQRLAQKLGSAEQLAQMAARQQMIRQGLEDVQQALGNRNDVLGRLDSIADEMDEVAQDMRERKVDDRILRRQERILSRLLTAQRSLRREDYREERVSRTGVNPADRTSPPPVQQAMTREELIRRGILRGSQDPVPDRYRGMVEEYFRSLSEQP